MERYFGTYQTFRTASRQEAAALLGSDNLVGDEYTIDCVLEEGEHKAWMVNRFGARVGYFDPGFSRELSLKKAQDMTLVAILSFVAFSEQPEPGEYWGQAAVLGYTPREKAVFEPFVQGIANLMGKGIRPQVDFEGRAVDQIIENRGQWLPDNREPMPEKRKGMAILKRKRSFTDGLVEQGRKGNKGCYFLSWPLMLGLVALIVFGLKACGVF